MQKNPDPTLTPNERARLAAVLAFLQNAALQKVWLVSASVVALQIRIPGRTLVLVVDGKRGIALEAADRPAGPDEALPAQAILRNGLAGARIESIGLARLAGSPGEPIVLVLAFATPRGPRTLIAEPGARPILALLAPHEKAGAGAEKIVWISLERGGGPAPEDRKPGLAYPARVPVVFDAAAHEAALAAAASADASRSAGAQADGGSAAESPATRPALDAISMLAADEAATVSARRAALLKQLKARQKKIERTLAAVQTDLLRAVGSEKARHLAELLLPHQGKIGRGAREAVVPDWSQLDDQGQPAQVTIKLDPALGAAENASRWLKKAQRYRAAIPRIEARQAEVGRLLVALREAHDRAAAATDKASLRAAEEDARAQGALAEAAISGEPADGGKRRKGRTATRLPFRSFRASSGARLLVGRDAKGNDELTLRWARGNDLWLHARGHTGSHVVVPEPGEAPDPRTLGDAALLAAHFSAARGTEQAEIAWTRRKYVRKTKGAAAGAVTYSQEKTLRIRLDEDRLRALLASETKPQH